MTALMVSARAGQDEVATLLRSLGYEPVAVKGADGVAAHRGPVPLCLIDLQENGEALRVARAVRGQHPEAVIIGIADPTRPTAAADAIRAGVFDVLPRPPLARDIAALIENAREQATLTTNDLQARSIEPSSFGIIGTSPAMRAVMDLVQRAAAGRCGILISGERGTGREMIARAIHAHGPNRFAPFVKLDCSGPEDVELQLLGIINRRSGAGAPERRSLERIGSAGRLAAAAGGILFLENVIDMPARAQAHFARVLRDREVFIDDDPHQAPLDVRMIAAVESSIDTAVEEGRLRRDLYERLSLIRIDVPALRQRREDIPVLATHFLKELCRTNGMPIKTLTRPALTLLGALQWRGNAPELRGLLERLILLVPQGLLRLEDVLAHTQLEGTISPTGFDATLRQARARFERDYISAVLQHQHGRIADAARVLGIQRTNLYRKMRRLNLIRARGVNREA